MMRYAQSGHLKRTDDLDRKRLDKVSAATNRARAVVVVLAAVAPAILALGLSQRTRLVVDQTVQTVQRAVPAIARAAHVLPPVAPTTTTTPPAAPAADTTVRDTLRANEALSQALARHEVGADDVSELVRDLKGVLDVRSLRAGARFSVKTEGRALQRFTFHAISPEGLPRRITADRLASVTPPAEPEGKRSSSSSSSKPPRFSIGVVDATVDTKVEGLAGTIRGSLYNGVLDAGGDANLVNKFVEVFAWNVDFYRQTQSGDEFRVLVEKRYAGVGDERRFLGYGKVMAAEYVNAGTSFRGFAFQTADQKFGGFFDEMGDALERTFLKNPMEIATVTSSYGMRFHPIRKQQSAHQGVDYGAPIGTPIFTVADGVVLDARYSKSAGNLVLVQHMNGIVTEYFHMSRFAEGLQKGSRVKQKQLIGYVGTTGLSTGPHLHFGMLRGGSHVDPSKQKFPNAKPVPATYRSEFDTIVQPLLAQLEALSRA
ncbi:MAG: peptidoglycan DD-metalloendopeptidase family protein [Deltaproteobacteria bacterium]|nr:peptidoglycan DD-metalloendopeptidase family protein [Deltaproteobacteria bacterium]